MGTSDSLTGCCSCVAGELGGTVPARFLCRRAARLEVLLIALADAGSRETATREHPRPHLDAGSELEASNKANMSMETVPRRVLGQSRSVPA